jgi:hypothetical protein
MECRPTKLLPDVTAKERQEEDLRERQDKVKTPDLSTIPDELN